MFKKATIYLLLFCSIAISSTTFESDPFFRKGKYRFFSNLTIETASWIGLFFLLPDSKEYRNLWFKSDGIFQNHQVVFKYTDGNNGFWTDKVAHPLIGSSIYGFLEESGYHPLEALGLTCLHSVAWELKEYAKTKKVQMKDAVWTMVPSGLYCLGDIMANEWGHIKFWWILGNVLSSPSHLGKLMYKGSLGLLENRERKINNKEKYQKKYRNLK